LKKLWIEVKNVSKLYPQVFEKQAKTGQKSSIHRRLWIKLKMIINCG